MEDFTRVFWLSLAVVEDISVAAVLASEMVSMEFRVDVKLCLEVDLRTVLFVRDGLVFGLSDLTDVWLFEEPAHRRPRNPEAVACICDAETPAEGLVDRL